MTKPSIPRTCQNCGQDFLAYASNIRRGYGKFCSNACTNRHRWANYTPKPKPARVKRARKSPAERFWSKVEKTEGCWLWTDAPHGFGYGSLSMGAGGVRKQQQAHRFSYELHHGPIPDGLCVLHHCDTPACVRPAHLFLGTKATNNLDMAMKERATSPLTTAQVRQIRIRYAKGGVTMKDLGREFGVHRVTVGQIVRRLRWAHI